jgi:hypothetical protein
MSEFSDSYVSRVLFATPAPVRSLDVAARRWRFAKDLSVRRVSVSARAALHARPGPEMARKARAQCWVRELIGNDRESIDRR